MNMRLAWYAGTSTALAAAVVASAFHQRANFYSAMVHLAQSSLSLMALANLVLVAYGSFMYGLQRLCFGPLRPTEIEQLYEKAWFAITETCLAMTIFRDEIGAFFVVMFTALVTGKVWGWIGDGRVEVLEQQPPANPLLFHTRLGLSLLVSIVYDILFLRYAVITVVEDARPTMMLMFLFEFAVLTVSSLHTASRYIISLVEQHAIKTQTRQRLEDRRRRIREQRAEIMRRRTTEGAAISHDHELPNENDVDEMDIEVPGWEAKGQWILSLDLFADFIKLGIYTAFFFVLLTFYGLPIHIMRDWFITTRSFIKRLHALIRYRQALKHMEQYPDATAEELGREDTCIICREEMRPWDPADTTQVERTRAKKLPCGHILHFGCLKSWLERQQVCPTCRRPVARDGQQPAAANGPAVVLRLGLGFPAGQNRQAQPPANGQAAPGGGQPAQRGAADDQANNHQNRNIRMFNLGPLRLGFAQGGLDEMREMAERMRPAPDVANPPAPTPTVPTPQEPNNDTGPDLDQIRGQLLTLGQQVRQEMANLHNAAHEIHIMSLLMNELTRLRQLQQQPEGQQHATQPIASSVAHGVHAPFPHPQQGLMHPYTHLPLQGQFPIPSGQHFMSPRSPSAVTRHVGGGYGTAIPAGSPDLPAGVVIPPGWSLLPLQRVDGEAQPPDSTTGHSSHGPAQDTLRSVLAHHPRSRGASPARGSSLSAHLGRTTVSTSNAEATRTPGTQGAPIMDTAMPRQPPVTAPVPRAPSWGGPSPLFRAERTTVPFGWQVELPQAPLGESGERSSSPGATAATTEVNGVGPGDGASAPQAGDGASAPQAGDGVVNGSGSDRVPRAATVEEAPDEEE
ncbi:hypothetical protein N657DRAFT_661576 [Parathielavia appendiculata]|uniref:RING-type E3 ubiquitin transferase n=1 Tax=Parathielavia appendiculata TaxID=2587402 RepID=A0AAN6U787_9PEZI|nr:hypothetical protein N657DRAFT_661576 [Parathielavia appendiculata]